MGVRDKKSVVRILVLSALFLVAGILALEKNLSRTMMDMAYARAYSIAVETVNRAVKEAVGDGLAYDRFIQTTLDAEGRIAMLRTNTAAMNELAATTALKAEQALNSIENQTIAVPLGSAFGVKFLAGSGPRIYTQIIPIGAVNTDFQSSFESAGINQTRHKIFLTLRATVSLILPNGSQKVEVQSSVPLAESIIVGQTPDSFVDVNNHDDLLNLLP